MTTQNPPTSHLFDASTIDRQGTSATKWQKYAHQDILPFWVADMEFRTPAFIIDAVQERLNAGVLGYTNTPDTLIDAFQQWCARNYQWRVEADWLVWLPGVVSGLNLSACAVNNTNNQANLIIPTPVYYPFRAVPANSGIPGHEIKLVEQRTKVGTQWVMDFDQLEQQLNCDSLFMLCNPQNPTGRCYDKAELSKLADLCLQKGALICSDEIHCELLLNGSPPHIPVASLGPEIADRSISLFAPTKTYNMPGLACAVAVIPNAQLRAAFKRARRGLIHGTGPLAFTAAETAWRDTSSWKSELNAYLTNNAQLLASTAGSRMTQLQATYLAWIDLTEFTGVDIHQHFESYGLGLSNGADFGGAGFLRFNIGCPTNLLKQGIERFERAINALNSS